MKIAQGRGILYNNHGHNRLECFTDADWAESKEGRRSTTGYCVFVGGNLVSWKSKKQSVVSRSSAESEHRAMTQFVCEIMWLHQLLMEVGIKTPVSIKLWCDNQTALHIASNSVFHERTKYIEMGNRAMTQFVCEIMWLHQLLMEVGIKTPVPIKLWCDNQTALHIASNLVFHERTKYIEMGYHFICEKIQPD